MNYYYITGTSRGIGLALAERLLSDPESHVIGLARGEGPVHERYRHIRIDLAQPAVVAEFVFEPCPEAERIVLVNNAGLAIGGRLGRVPAQGLIDAFNVNIVAPALLTNAFVAAYEAVDADKVVLNVSSGAGRAPVAGAAPMSTTKSAIDMLTRVLAEEQKLSPGSRLTAISVAPGLVRTAMYEAVMRAPVGDAQTSAVQERLRSQNVSEPGEVAEKLVRLLNHANELSEPLTSLSTV